MLLCPFPGWGRLVAAQTVTSQASCKPHLPTSFLKLLALAVYCHRWHGHITLPRLRVFYFCLCHFLLYAMDGLFNTVAPHP